MGTKSCLVGPGHVTKMATTPIYGKNLKNRLQNQLTDGLETWYVALGTRELPKLLK